ncbi:hypothetical protein SAMN05445756_0554 [Kytococcus aerolatus]|uniref:Probable membrane transporter protein n=1 Tax=Kytococcus aerolatus TaxID=592308 RepID=A0A212T6X8_9MICO|nr:sulfite exporter TauE/SafE family protein [Kytococcus aerolatus]SNC61792.1 hypothetical protein SAMN05445756_0554 [Kytococcus aerolatus]
MTELFTGDFLPLLLVSSLIGVVIGLTGMGGGALMTPALVFLGIPPSTAVANDLVAAAVNKSVGATVHAKHGSPHFKLAKWLIIGSVPTAFAGAFIIDNLGDFDVQQTFLKTAIGCTLLITATTYFLRMYLELARGILDDPNAPDPEVRPIPTLLIGTLGGLLVGITSVGSGTLIMVLLLLLYPALSAVKLVGTDLVQAIPLVVSAAIGHVIVNGVDWSILVPLLIGGAPGTFLGARLAAVVPQSIVRRGIVIVLTVSSLAMLGVPSLWVGFSGAALLILGPVVWGLLRMHHGLPAFENEHLPGGRPKAARGRDSE